MSQVSLVFEAPGPRPITCRCGGTFSPVPGSTFPPNHRAPCGRLCVRGGAIPPDVCWGANDPYEPCPGCGYQAPDPIDPTAFTDTTHTASEETTTP